MADTNPLFLSDFDELLVALRLDGLIGDTNVASEERMVEEALRRARLGIVKRLGLDAVSDLQAIPFEANPSTNDEYRRMSANSMEILWTKKILLCDFNVFFLESSGDAREAFNEEGLLRNMTPEKVKELIACVSGQLEAILDDIEGTDRTKIGARTFGPETSEFPGAQYYRCYDE